MSESSGGTDDLDARFDAIVDGLRRDVRSLLEQVERFGHEVQRGAPAAPGATVDEIDQRAQRRLKQLRLAAAQIESGAAYLMGSGIVPRSDDDERPDGARRVLESLEAERARLYRDVHDGPAQGLANAIFDVEYLERMIERAPEELRSSLRSEFTAFKTRLRASLDAVRGMIYDLRPPVLAELGLAGAIRDYAAEFEVRCALRMSCELDPSETRLLPQQELAVYRVMQEALQNIHKHAHATSVRVSWERSDGGWRLVCADDGRGFDLVKAARRATSVGLVAMRERAELIGGTLHIDSVSGQGTTVTLRLPLAKEEEGSRG